MSELRGLIEVELGRPPPAQVAWLAEALAARSGAVAAVLFYGSVLREPAADGVVDLYVLVDSLSAWPGAGPVAAAAGRVLPPNVEHHRLRTTAGEVRAKVAVMRLDQFENGVRPGAVDTTLWARFSQPAVLAWSRDGAARDRVSAAVTQAVITAARWAAALGPERGRPAEFWTALFRQTYAAELRVERGGRESQIIAAAAERYERLSPAAFLAAGVRLSAPDDAGWITPQLTAAERRRMLRGWRFRRALGRPLNLLRLVKAAFTFKDGADYIAWKIERHTGVPLNLSDWQRRHPILAAPGVLIRLKRSGVLR